MSDGQRVDGQTVRRVWGRYWRHLALSAVLFAAGVAVGALTVDVVDLSVLFGTQNLEGSLPEPTVGLLVANNTVVMMVLLASGLTLGLGTAGILVYNGFIVGHVMMLVARAEGPTVVAVGLLPHGVVEIPAILLAAAVAFRFSHQVVAAATGRRTDVMTRPELYEAAALAGLALVLIPVAAYIEANVTTALLEGAR